MISPEGTATWPGPLAGREAGARPRPIAGIRTGGELLRLGLADGFAVPLVLLGVFAAQILRGIRLLPQGYDGAGGLNTTLTLLLIIWCLGMTVRCMQPTSRLASGIAAFALFFALSIFSALAAAANAIGSKAYVDPALVWLDRTLFPFYDWPAVAHALTRYPGIYRALNEIYGSLSWQPLVLIVLTMMVGKVRDLGIFVTSWGLGLLGCILPFHWLPARSPYGHYAISQDALPGHMVGLPWEFAPILEGMRDGSIRAIEMQCLTGMVTIPSFHACAATILACAFWRFTLLRWPFLALNAAMAIAAVPIGSHYLIDIVAGVAVGLLAVILARRLVHGPARGRAEPDQKGRSLPV